VVPGAWIGHAMRGPLRARLIAPSRRSLRRVSFAEADALVAAARRGESRAIEELARKTAPEVWRFLAHLVDVESADDLTQETYLRAFGALRRFRGASSLRTWLLSIARRVTADELRRR